MTMNSLSRMFYKISRLLRDFNAIRRGRIGNRLVNKLIGRGVVSKMWRR